MERGIELVLLSKYVDSLRKENMKMADIAQTIGCGERVVYRNMKRGVYINLSTKTLYTPTKISIWKRYTTEEEIEVFPFREYMSNRGCRSVNDVAKNAGLKRQRLHTYYRRDDALIEPVSGQIFVPRVSKRN
ncbi:hypothetical protein JCM19233_6177 [Vibrio astriarenae]|nr:hypothetical protein JCM19233_6177 [Vibrio sp. C7]